MAKQHILDKVKEIYLGRIAPKPFDGIKTFCATSVKIGESFATEYGTVKITQYLGTGTKYKGRFVDKAGNMFGDAYMVVRDYATNSVNIKNIGG